MQRVMVDPAKCQSWQRREMCLVLKPVPNRMKSVYLGTIVDMHEMY